MEAKAFRKRKTVLASDFLCGGGVMPATLKALASAGAFSFALVGAGHGEVLL